MGTERKSLKELGLCSHIVELDEKEIELAVRLGIDFDAMWDEAYEEENHEERSRFEVEIHTEITIQTYLEILMRILLKARENPQKRERLQDDLSPIAFLTEGQVDTAL